MKTLPDGTPQLDVGDFPFSETQINMQLQEWSAARRCVKCKWYRKGGPLSFPRCDRLFLDIYRNKHGDIDPETFSCAAFERKNS